MSETYKIRPYARLITMLGDQLIKNELIAIVELIKNAYDADANWVKVTYESFNDDFSINNDSKIIIEDDGCGMNKDILVNHWLNPATPEKKIRKETSERTEKGRIMQGEKGIGRFAIFKLGKQIKITTRKKDENIENVLTYDFSNYDNEFLKKDGKDELLYIDDLNVLLEQRVPSDIIKKKVTLGTIKRERNPFGTKIEISNLKGFWSDKLVEKIQKDIGKLQPIFENDNLEDFRVYIYKDGNEPIANERYKEKLHNLLQTKAVLNIQNGHYDENRQTIYFDNKEEQISLSFHDSDLNNLRIFRQKFKDKNYKTECGSFDFQFYIFDFNSKNTSRYYLDGEDKKIIKEHRIYLYRDGIRVFPYGDPDDDWLQIDVLRGTISAGAFLSNNQVVGCVYITQKNNPKLKDKTNREGLIEEGKALSDFITILQLILSYIRNKPYERYNIDKNKKIEMQEAITEKPQNILDNLKKQVGDDDKSVVLINEFEKSYTKEKSILLNRIEKVESLAAVGLSVETASHDVMLFLKKVIEQLDKILGDLMQPLEIDREALFSHISSARGTLSLVETQMKDIQLLFPSTKSKTKNIKIREIIDKVERLYQRAFKETGITCNIIEVGSPLIVKTTDAVLLQVFINLFDNSLYFTKLEDNSKKVEIYLDGDNNRVIFSDSGPGVNEDDGPYIFEAFYSGKGEDGRGLGLYIARQLLDRYDSTIDLAQFSKDKRLTGANFVLEFAKNNKE